MAWEPSSSSWDWETDGAIVQGHGLDHRKLPVSGWPCEVERCEIKHGRTSSPSHFALEGRCGVAMAGSSRADPTGIGDFLCNQVVTPAMANIHSSLLFHDTGSPSNAGPMLQGRVPIVTTCIGCGLLSGANDNANGSLESVVHKRFDEGHGNENSQNNGRWFDKIKQTDLEQLHLSGKRQDLVADIIGRDDCSAPKDTIERNICNHMKITEIDEQHSSGAKSSALSSDSPTGLQLGKRTYPLDVVLPVAAKATSKSNAASKKTRGSAAASQVPRCQVEGCKLDLSSAKDYHRRHKVCEPHSKAGKVVVASLEQRFCQQCSRFHILTEFDETKRSCRRRLAGHNKRRRKPRPDPLELQAQLRSSFEDWPFFYSSRLSRLGRWQDAAQSQSSILWPRKLVDYYGQPSLDCSFEGSGPDMFMKGFSSPMTHDKFPLLLLQSPKMVMSTSSCDQRVDNRLPDVVGGAALGNGPRLVSVMSGPGVSTNTGTAPVMEATRVSNSGRALSLLSLQVQCSQAPDMVSLDLSGPINTSINNNSYQMQDAVASAQQQFLLHGEHPYCQDFSTTLSISSNTHHSEEGPVVIADRDLFEPSFLNSLHRHGEDYQVNGNCLASSKQLRSHCITGQAKETQDLMQLVSFQVPNRHCQSPSAIFNVDSNSPLSEPHLLAETSFLRF